MTAQQPTRARRRKVLTGRAQLRLWLIVTVGFTVVFMAVGLVISLTEYKYVSTSPLHATVLAVEDTGSSCGAGRSSGTTWNVSLDLPPYIGSDGGSDGEDVVTTCSSNAPARAGTRATVYRAKDGSQRLSSDLTPFHDDLYFGLLCIPPMLFFLVVGVVISALRRHAAGRRAALPASGSVEWAHIKLDKVAAKREKRQARAARRAGR